MDTAWIQVFVLSLSECVAPAGKTVCQEQLVQYEFYDRAECEAVLQQFIEYSAGAENIIINTEKSQCLATVRQSQTFRTLQQANRELGNIENLDTLPLEDDAQEDAQEGAEQDTPRESSTEHAARLEKLPDCDSDYSITPCKVGQIIVETDATREIPVWRRDN
ncbi:MAG: hypothetical protein WDZ50_04525 [Woeseia sp.]